MDVMMNGKEIKFFECKNLVDKQFQMGQMVGVQGMLVIVFVNGQLFFGYQLVKQLVKLVLEVKQCWVC